MLNIAIIIGSTRPNRVGESVARWVFDQVKQRKDATFELIDLRDYNLPLLDEPIPPSMGKYSNDHTLRWSEKISEFDAFIFVSPEYNHGTSGALKNAIDFLYKEWNNKVAGFVAYGSAGGTRAVENLRLIMAECQVATVRTQVALSLHDDFENYTTFRPRDMHAKNLTTLVDQILSWGEALTQVRPMKMPLSQTNQAQNASSPSIH